MRIRSPGLAVALAMLPVMAAAVPMGRVVWTQQKGKDFAVYTYTYLPAGVPRALVDDGLARVDPSAFLARTGTELKAEGVVSADSPAATLRFMHPCLDFTGLRLLFTDGAAWGPSQITRDARPKPKPDATIQPGSMAIGFGLAGQLYTKPQDEGATFDAFPVSDTEGRCFYFSRFFYKAPQGLAPGWYLMQRPWESGAAALLTDVDGAPVPGYQPCLASSGRHLFFVRGDPDNVGSDIWYLPVAPRGKAQLLVNGEGTPARPQLGRDRDFWMLYTKNLGKSRISHPTVSGDGAFLAYASDRDGEWDVYIDRLEYPEAGQVRVGADEATIGGTWGSDVADDEWPSLSGDGHYLAMMTHRQDALGTKAGAEPRIWVAGNPLAGPEYASFMEPCPGAPKDGSSLWPYWDQDEDPPHLQITLKAGDGGEATVLRLQDEEPDQGPGIDIERMSLQMRDYSRDVPAPGAPGRSDLAPVNIGFPGGEALARLRYPTGGEDGNSFRLLLSGKRERLGKHRGFKALAGETGEPYAHRVLTSADFDGLYVFENVRVEVKVQARDNRWLRRNLPPELKDKLYPGGSAPPPAEESADFVPTDPRALANPVEAPWFSPIRRSEREAGYPGICWWVEELASKAETDEGATASMENAPELLFRIPNDPPERYPDQPLLFLRVVARDLLGNETDVRIPIHVRAKDFGVNTLEMKSERQR